MDEKASTAAAAAQPHPGLGRLLIAIALVALIVPSAAQARKNGKRVVSQPVSFEVVNTNTSATPGSFDNQEYTVKGQLVARRSKLRGRKNPLDSVALYLHGLSYDQNFWHLEQFPRFDYAKQLARKGHRSIVIDRLGYGESGKPQGTRESYGSQADIANQIVDDLRSGDYVVKGERKGREHRAGRFERVALGGHSASGFISQIAAYSYDNVDALMVMALADQGASPLAIQTDVETTAICATGGERSDGDSGPGGYAYFGQTEQDFRSAHFHSAPKRLEDLAAKLRTRDPCGETGSVVQSIVFDTALVGSIDEPVLLVYGAEDDLFPPPSEQTQRLLYSGTDDLTSRTFENTGHGLTFEATAPEIQDYISGWLKKRGF